MKPIDLPRVQRARNALAQVVKQHPRLKQGGGRWEENLEELKRVMGTPATERVRQYRTRLRQQGRVRVSVFLTPDAHTALMALRSQNPGVNTNDLVSGVLTGKISAA